MKKFQPSSFQWFRYRLAKALIDLGYKIKPRVPIAVAADGTILFGHIDHTCWGGTPMGVDGTVGEQDV